VVVKQAVAEPAAAGNWDCTVHKCAAIVWARRAQIFK